MSRLPNAHRWRNAAQSRHRVVLADGTIGTLTRWPTAEGRRCTVVAQGQHLHPTTDQVRLVCYRCDEDPVAPGAPLPLCDCCMRTLTHEAHEVPA